MLFDITNTTLHNMLKITDVMEFQLMNITPKSKIIHHARNFKKPTPK